MPKDKSSAKSNSASRTSTGPLLNKDLGQHILKNPLVANGIIEKVKNSQFYS